jgi:hypothetical protein
MCLADSKLSFKRLYVLCRNRHKKEEARLVPLQTCDYVNFQTPTTYDSYLLMGPPPLDDLTAHSTDPIFSKFQNSRIFVFSKFPVSLQIFFSIMKRLYITASSDNFDPPMIIGLMDIKIYIGLQFVKVVTYFTRTTVRWTLESFSMSVFHSIIHIGNCRVLWDNFRWHIVPQRTY